MSLLRKMKAIQSAKGDAPVDEKVRAALALGEPGMVDFAEKEREVVQTVLRRPPLSERSACVDDLLRGDAAHAPAFAFARRAVVAGLLEGREPVTRRQIADVLAGLLAYEDERGGLTAPREGAAKVAAKFGVWEEHLRTYERARSQC